MSRKIDIIIGMSAAVLAYVIYGLNMVFCKDLTSSGLITPTGIFVLRALGASLLFWTASLFFPKERAGLKDIGLICLASLFGITIPQFSTLFGITMSTPFDASLLNTLKPLWAALATLAVCGEHASKRTWAGIVIGMSGALLLVFFNAGPQSEMFRTTPLGLLVISLNGISLALYLTIFGKLIKKFSAVTLMKWGFLCASLISFPFAADEIVALPYSSIPGKIYGELIFLIIAATFIANFLATIAQKRISPTQYSITSYIQPITAALVSLSLGMDAVSIYKIAAMALMIAGVWITVSYDRNPKV